MNNLTVLEHGTLAKSTYAAVQPERRLPALNQYFSYVVVFVGTSELQLSLLKGVMTLNRCQKVYGIYCSDILGTLSLFDAYRVGSYSSVNIL